MSCLSLYFLYNKKKKGVRLLQRERDGWVLMARFYAGFLNAGMLLYIHTMLTLHTGNLTRLMVSLVQVDWQETGFLLMPLLAFFGGCLLTHLYYVGRNKQSFEDYWRGYFAIGVLFFVLWLLPRDSWAFIGIMSFSMGIFSTLSLKNRDYTGNISMVTGLIVEIASQLAKYWRLKQAQAKEQALYLLLNLLAYALGVACQAGLTQVTVIVRAWPMMVLAWCLAIWAYYYEKKEASCLAE